MSIIVQYQAGEFFFDTTIPLRIVSLVPSITELLYDLGLEHEVVGITKFCVHPEGWVHSKTGIGGTKNVSIPKVLALRPSLIIASKEENIKEQVEELSTHFPVLLTEVVSIKSACEMIKQIGQLTGTNQKAGEISERIFKNYLNRSFQKKCRVIYLIWKNPFMAAGGDTFINSMLEAAGFENILASKDRYPVLSINEMIKLNPEALLFSSEPFPFKQRHADELKQLTGIEKIVLVDGEMFSWYGSRMLKAIAYFAELRESLFLGDETFE